MVLLPVKRGQIHADHIEAALRMKEVREEQQRPRVVRVALQEQTLALCGHWCDLMLVRQKRHHALADM